VNCYGTSEDAYDALHCTQYDEIALCKRLQRLLVISDANIDNSNG